MVRLREIIAFYGRKVQVSEILQCTQMCGQKPLGLAVSMVDIAGYIQRKQGTLLSCFLLFIAWYM